MYENYLKILESLKFENSVFGNTQKALLLYDPLISYEETFSWICTVLALKAASLGNLGVGALLVRDNTILYEACNEMLKPTFRSDAHPEMSVITAFEKLRSIGLDICTDLIKNFYR